MTCPGFEQLVDYLDGRLEQEAFESVAGHLEHGCRRCDEYRVWYQQVKLIGCGDDSIEPPPWVLKRALRLFNVPKAKRSIGPQLVEVVASLVFDSLRRPAVAGVRSGGLEGRQLLYRAADYSIDVQVAGSDQMRADLTGQILREGELMFESVSGLQLELMRDGGTILSTVTNDRGEFTMPSIEFGAYDLRVDVSETSITIVGLPVVD